MRFKGLINPFCQTLSNHSKLTTKACTNFAIESPNFMIFQVCTSNSFLPSMTPKFLVNLNELAFIFGSLSFPPLAEIICPLSLKKSLILIVSKSFSTTSGWELTTTSSIGPGESIKRETNRYHIPGPPSGNAIFGTGKKSH